MREFFLLLMMWGCARSEIEPSRKSVPRIKFDSEAGLSMAAVDADAFYDNREEYRRYSSCDWLKVLSQQKTEFLPFKMLDRLTLSPQNEEQRRKMKGLQRRRIQENRASDSDKSPAVFFNDFDGRVDIGKNPFLQYAMLPNLQEIPDENRFLEKVDNEIFSSLMNIFKLPYRGFLAMPWVNVITHRNSFVKEALEQSLPGVFDAKTQENSSLKDTPLDILIRNSVPLIDTLNPNFLETEENNLKNEEILRSILTSFTTEVPLFRRATWSDWRNDMRMSLNIALLGIQSDRIEDQACSSILFHRAFAQMLSIMGYDRLPLKVRDHSFELEDVDKLLHTQIISETHTDKNGRTKTKKVDHSSVMVCPQPGSFLNEKGQWLKLNADMLGAFSEKADSIYLSKYIVNNPVCLKEATVESTEESRSESIEKGFSMLPEYAGLREIAQFLSGIHYYLVGFNPGAKWWFSDSGKVPLPLAYFNGMESLKESGAILPTQSYGLAMGFLGVVGMHLYKHHLFLLGRGAIQTERVEGALAIRFSEEPKEKLTTPWVRTEIRSASLLIEMAIRMSKNLEYLADWDRISQMRLEEELLEIPEQEKRSAVRREYNDFIQSMFGGRKNLDTLIADDAQSVRKVLEKIKLAMTLLLADFRKPEDPHNPSPDHVNCYNEIRNNLQTGEQEKIGDCSSQPREGDLSDKQTWLDALELARKAFRSPILDF